jgi:hypothetical protein
MTTMNCKDCKWWDRESPADTIVSPFGCELPDTSPAFRCSNPHLKATGIHYESGRLLSIYTLPDFGCLQFEGIDRPIHG